MRFFLTFSLFFSTFFPSWALNREDIVMWVGRGSQEAILVFDWKEEQASSSSFAWGYRWEGTTTVEAMLKALSQANPRLRFLTNIENSSLYGVAYDVDGDGMKFQPTPEGTETGSALNPKDYYREGRFVTGEWVLFTSKDSGTTWQTSSAPFLSQTLHQGSWYGWSFAPGFHSTPPSEPLPAPLPFSSSTGAGALPNGYDQPIAGFIGSDGEGKTPHLGFSNNYLNPVFTGWASSIVEYQPFDARNVNQFFLDPRKALGPVTGDPFDVVSLDDMLDTEIAAYLTDPNNQSGPGTLTVQFEQSIFNGAGADFAIFENGITSLFSTPSGSHIDQIFAELAYVEVSSNGTDFARFPSISLTENLVGEYGTLSAEAVYNLAGKHTNAGGDSWGTPFDLADLLEHSLVLEGLVDLEQIYYIRLVDIPGSGDFLDDLGSGIFDAWVTFGSGGADIEAIGALNQRKTFQAWQDFHFPEAIHLPQYEAKQPEADPDHDGVSNLLEYAFALDPREPTWASSPHHVGFLPQLQIDASNKHFIFFRDSRQTDLTYTVQVSSDLTHWTDLAQSIQGQPVQPLGSFPTDHLMEQGDHFVEVQVTIPPEPSTPKQFFRVLIQEREP